MLSIGKAALQRSSVPGLARTYGSGSNSSRSFSARHYSASSGTEEPVQTPFWKKPVVLVGIAAVRGLNCGL